MTAVATYTELRRNIVLNPRAVLGGNVALGNHSGAAPTIDPAGGRYAVATTGTTAPSVRLNSTSRPAAVSDGQLWSGAMTITAVRAGAYSLQMRGSTTQSGTTQVGSTKSTTVTLAAGDTARLENPGFAVPAGSGGMYMLLVAPTGTYTVGEVACYVTELQLEQAPTPGPFFDGDTPGVAGTNLDYAWTGAPDLSPSIFRQQITTVAATPPAVFQPTADRVWTLGDPDNPDLSFQGIDTDGVEWAISDPRGWYGSPPVDLGLEDRPTDGSWFGRGAYKARVVEVAGAFRACSADALEDAAMRLQDALDPRTSTLLAVTENPAKQLTVRPSSEVMVEPVPGHRLARRFSFVLTAADPFKYAAGADGVVTVPMVLLDPASIPGTTFDEVFPLDFGGAIDLSGGRGAAFNPGQLPIAPVLTIRGPVSFPMVQNLTTDEVFGLAVTLGSGSTAVVDMNQRTVVVDGVSRFSWRAPRTNFWALARGANDVRFTAATYSAAASAVLTYRPRWK